jgi:hypothetical protein
MKVIGAGFGRTGTLSLKVALEELGFGPCYHMFEAMKNPAHAKAWAAAGRGEPVDWEEIYGGYQATVDWPGCSYYEQLAEAYPEAKVLLSVRDPESWYESTLATLYDAHKVARTFSANAGRPAQRAAHPIWEDTFSGRFEDKRHAIGIFERHNERVKESIPPDRLLVYEVKDGWEPLCAFLGVEPPEGRPFPRLNSRADFPGLMASEGEEAARAALELYRRDYAAARTRLHAAVVGWVPPPEVLWERVQASESLAQRAAQLQAAGRSAEARSCLERARVVADSVRSAQTALRAAVADTTRNSRVDHLRFLGDCRDGRAGGEFR